MAYKKASIQVYLKGIYFNMIFSTLLIIGHILSQLRNFTVIAFVKIHIVSISKLLSNYT